MLFLRSICAKNSRVISFVSIALLLSGAAGFVVAQGQVQGQRPGQAGAAPAFPRQQANPNINQVAPAGNRLRPASSTNPNARPPVNPAAQAAAVGAQPNLSDPFNLTPAEQQRLNKLLGFWENKSGGLKTYTCDFKRWDYNAVFGPKNPKQAFTISEGKIRYAAPDKGEFEVETIAEWKMGAGGKPGFVKRTAEHEEHWICDGNSIFELNGKTKQLIQQTLPPEMRGKAIADGPLPFMFGAKRDKLLKRYWLKELVPPANRKGEYWIEARPKLRADAANFKRILVILDEKRFMPIAMQVYPPGFNAKNWTRQAYAFTSRKGNDPLQRGQAFLGQFISPKVPRGWKKVVNRFDAPAPMDPPKARIANPGNNPPAGSRPLSANGTNGQRQRAAAARGVPRVASPMGPRVPVGGSGQPARPQ